MSHPKAESAPSLSDRELRQIDARWRASNYLSVRQIYLLDDPLPRKPLAREHIPADLPRDHRVARGGSRAAAVAAARPKRSMSDARAGSAPVSARTARGGA